MMRATTTKHGSSVRNQRYVGFWARAWASLLDTLLTVVVTLPLLISVYGWSYMDNQSFVKGPLDFFISWILPGIAIITFWVYCAATPGKMAIRAHIVDATTGQHPTQGQLILRYLGYMVSALPLCLGFFWAAFDPKKQGWHDKIAGTVVVYAGAHPSTSEVSFFQEGGDAYPVVVEQEQPEEMAVGVMGSRY